MVRLTIFTESHSLFCKMEQTLQAGEEESCFLFGGVKASTASCNCFKVYAETIPTASTTTVVDVMDHPLHGRVGMAKATRMGHSPNPGASGWYYDAAGNLTREHEQRHVGV